MSALQEVLESNRAYAAGFGEKGNLALPPARQFAILTCMDARLDPAKYAGLAEGDAVRREALCLLHDLCGVQERFRGDAPDVQADTSKRRITLDENRGKPEIRGTKRRRVAARPGTEHDHVAFQVSIP